MMKFGTVAKQRSYGINYQYIYVAGATAQTIKKYNLSDLSFTNIESPSYGSGVVRDLYIQGDYIYAAGSNIRKIKQYNLSDLSATGLESPDFGRDIFTMCSDGTYIYVAGSATADQPAVRKYLISDLSFAGESASTNLTAYALAYHDDYIYFGGYGVSKVRRFLASDLSEVDDRAYSGYCHNIIIEDGYTYLSGYRYVHKVPILNWATATAFTYDKGLNVQHYGLAISNDYLFFDNVVSSVYYINRLNKSDLTSSQVGTIGNAAAPRTIIYHDGRVYYPLSVDSSARVAYLLENDVDTSVAWSEIAYGGHIYSMVLGEK